MAGRVGGHAAVRHLPRDPLPAPVGRGGEAELSPGPDAARHDQGVRRRRPHAGPVPLPAVLGRVRPGLPAAALQRGHLLLLRAAGVHPLHPADGDHPAAAVPGTELPRPAVRSRGDLPVPLGHPRQPRAVLPAVGGQARGPRRRRLRGRGVGPADARGGDPVDGELRRHGLRRRLVGLGGAAAPEGGVGPGAPRRGGPGRRAALPPGRGRAGAVGSGRRRLGRPISAPACRWR